MSTWLTKKSTHYLFHFSQGSVAEKEIDKIVTTQEIEYQKTIDFLATKNDRIINYFLYPNNKTKGELSGNDGNGHAERDKFEVHAVYNNEIKCIGAHEDTHLLTSFLGLPPQLFREGLAEYMSGNWHNVKHDEWAVRFLAEGKLPDLAQIIDDEKWYELDDSISYPSAGSFVGFLIQKLGREKFLELYKALNRDFTPKKNTTIFQKIADSTISGMQAEWQNGLNKLSK